MMNATSTTTRNEVVPVILDELRGMIYNFARRLDLEFDDCRNIKAYLTACVRGELYRRMLRRESTVSLDAPVTAESTETFADMLADFVKQDSQRSDEVTETVHKALRGLSLEVQLHARDFYGLGDYTPVLPRSARKVAYGRKKEYMRESLRRSFRKNEQVLSLIQHETCVL